MIVNKDATAPETIKLCDDRREPGPCPWGKFVAVTLYVNGFPHKRVIRRSQQLLESQVRAWLESPLPEWRP